MVTLGTIAIVILLLGGESASQGTPSEDLVREDTGRGAMPMPRVQASFDQKGPGYFTRLEEKLARSKARPMKHEAILVQHSQSEAAELKADAAEADAAELKALHVLDQSGTSKISPQRDQTVTTRVSALEDLEVPVPPAVAATPTVAAALQAGAAIRQNARVQARQIESKAEEAATKVKALAQAKAKGVVDAAHLTVKQRYAQEAAKLQKLKLKQQGMKAVLRARLKENNVMINAQDLSHLKWLQTRELDEKLETKASAGEIGEKTMAIASQKIEQAVQEVAKWRSLKSSATQRLAQARVIEKQALKDKEDAEMKALSEERIFKANKRYLNAEKNDAIAALTKATHTAQQIYAGRQQLDAH